MASMLTRSKLILASFMDFFKASGLPNDGDQLTTVAANLKGANPRPTVWAHPTTTPRANLSGFYGLPESSRMANLRLSHAVHSIGASE